MPTATTTYDRRGFARMNVMGDVFRTDGLLGASPQALRPSDYDTPLLQSVRTHMLKGAEIVEIHKDHLVIKSPKRLHNRLMLALMRACRENSVAIRRLGEVTGSNPCVCSM